MVRFEISALAEANCVPRSLKTYFIPSCSLDFRQTDLPDERAWCRNMQGLRVVIWIEWAARMFSFTAPELDAPPMAVTERSFTC